MRCNSCGTVVNENCKNCPNCHKKLDYNVMEVNNKKRAKSNKKKGLNPILVIIFSILNIYIWIKLLPLLFLVLLILIGTIDTKKDCVKAYDCTLNEEVSTYTCYKDYWLNESTEVICEEDKLEIHQFADSVLMDKLESKEFVVKEKPIGSMNGYYVLKFNEIEENQKLYYKFNPFFEISMFRNGDRFYINDVRLELDESDEIKFYIYDNYLLCFNSYIYVNDDRNILFLKYDEEDKKISSLDLNEEEMFVKKIYEANGKTRIELLKIINDNHYFDKKYKSDICNMDKNNKVIVSKTIEYDYHSGKYLDSYVADEIVFDDFIRKNNLCE